MQLNCWLQIFVLVHKILPDLIKLCSSSRISIHTSKLTTTFFKMIFVIYSYLHTHTHSKFSTWLFFYTIQIVKSAQTHVTLSLNHHLSWLESTHKVIKLYFSNWQNPLQADPARLTLVLESCSSLTEWSLVDTTNFAKILWWLSEAW